MNRLRLRLLLPIAMTLLLNGCETLHYYAQAAKGQFNLLRKRIPIEQVLADPKSDPKVRQKLERVVAARRFAMESLSLPGDKHYLTYVQLPHPYVVWNVFAAPELSMAPQTWCYPIVGCVAYRGFFSEADAQSYGERLRQQGLDVYVGGIAAYSTLGWFDDPVLSSFFYRDDDDLVSLIFHELAHQVLYLDDDTTFNESFATTVELAGLRRWFAAEDRPDEYQNHLRKSAEREEFIQLVLRYRQELDQLYRSPRSEAEKRQKKGKVIEALREEYRTNRQHWLNPKGYERWFENDLNNAKLNTIATYHDLVEPMEALLASLNDDLPAFYVRCRELGKLDKAERHRQLKALLAPK